MAVICACVSATPPLVARIEFLMLVTPEIPAFICATLAPRWLEVANGPWQPAQFVA
jgi:hypothetical protein